MNKYRVKGTVQIRAKTEFLVLAKSPDEAWDLCEDHPRDCLNLSTLEQKACDRMEFEADEIIEIGKRVSRRA